MYFVVPAVLQIALIIEKYTFQESARGMTCRMFRVYKFLKFFSELLGLVAQYGQNEPKRPQPNENKIVVCRCWGMCLYNVNYVNLWKGWRLRNDFANGSWCRAEMFVCVCCIIHSKENYKSQICVWSCIFFTALHLS